MALGTPNLPEVLIFTHSIAAVAANPETHQWVESILRTTNDPAGETVMGRTYRSFLLFEFRRLGCPQW
jgi:phage baseplate assembly protein W